MTDNNLFRKVFNNTNSYLEVYPDKSKWERINSTLKGLRNYPILRVDGQLRMQILPTGGVVPIQNKIIKI
jgi:hypothetical protein